MELAPDLQLPSLPEVTLRALEACHDDASFQTISGIISADTGLVGRVLSLANLTTESHEGRIRSIEQALICLGPQRLRSLVLTAALNQLQFGLGNDDWRQIRDFWRHSLTTALTARALATLTGYPYPEEAFMLGVLHNIGELVAIKATTPDARQHYLNNQSEVAADLVSAWGLGPMAADAMRYQQAAPEESRDAGHLVKLISLATRLALSDAAGIAAADTVFGLSEELTREINRRIAHEVTGIASSLGIALDDNYDGERATRELQEVILQQAIVNQALDFAEPGQTTDSLIAEAANSLGLITGSSVLGFAPRDKFLALIAGTGTDAPELTISPNPGGSALTEAFNTGNPVKLTGRNRTVLDRQLLSLLRTPSMIAIPVNAGSGCAGVFALGSDETRQDSTLELASLFSHRLGQIVANRQATGQITDSAENLQQELDRQQLRKQVHEVNNPLTIIRQYIYQLRNRLDDPDVHQELDIIREELDRAGDLLQQMGQKGTGPEHAGGISLNDELDSLSRIVEDSLFDDGKRRLRLDLTDNPALVSGPASALRQVIINLLRNASEALPESGGTVTLRTSAPVWQNQRTWVELEISDTGTGIPEAVRDKLFAPVKTTKGDGHSGLGLSIVKQLVDDMDGIIACRTGSGGTTFRILLPATLHKKKTPDDKPTGTDQ
ncbi:HDOD domain-containing protein [Marinobacter pelagius]|uniref:histidine kinase n=1 Tax=Marinobacter pelagius TaxID=379482 RepID=A0A1I4Y2W8_9GAMM|nr:HDOD domain-containing protein [Marinobacter pelagius]SFN32386.1 Histidine kinase-, DNA gyrase B-, and HSP90-like ATPase [Marinobacter pelagius]